jgi:hypothetical protein
LPAFFNQYEVQLLNLICAVQLIKKPGFFSPPSAATVSEFQASRQQQLIDQNAEYRQRQIETSRQVFASQCTGRRQKGKNKKRTANPPDYEAILKSKIEQILSQEIQDPLVQVLTEHPVVVGK